MYIYIILYYIILYYILWYYITLYYIILDYTYNIRTAMLAFGVKSLTFLDDVGKLLPHRTVYTWSSPTDPPAFIWACLRWYVNLPVGNWFFSGAPNQQHQGISISTRSKVSISRTGCVFYHLLSFKVTMIFHLFEVFVYLMREYDLEELKPPARYIYRVWYSVDSTLAIWKITYIILSFFYI